MCRHDQHAVFKWSGTLAIFICGSVPGCGDLCLRSESFVADAPVDYETALTELYAEVGAFADTGLEPENIVVGLCGDNGPRFVLRFPNPWTPQYDYYDLVTGAFIGRTIYQWEVHFPWPCAGGGFWPRYILCSERTITEVISGTRYEVGDGGRLYP